MYIPLLCHINVVYCTEPSSCCVYFNIYVQMWITVRSSCDKIVSVYFQNVHHTFDRNLTRDFESKFKEKHRRLRMNFTYRRPVSHAGTASKGSTNHLRRTARGQRVKHQSFQPYLTPFFEDESDGSFAKPVLQM